ncbi:MAG: 1,4-dihydroxy-2-naphthoate octaprenyltransferase [Candidatus Cryptobacteroides sp.]|nr:1,4-dihydroxy-2-naphthoate octaprenyltransferase [Bacteroidales bacterium]
MNKISFYINSMRLRTLPLSLAGVVLGIMLAASDYRVSWPVILLILLTTVCLQILCNICNELGDTLSGVDGEGRSGPMYSLGEGGLTVREMKWFIGVMVVCCIASGLLMIRASFGTLLDLEPICLMMLGAAAISGAIKYTLGRNPYGYRGLGDISVFIFFGIVSVLGSYFVAARALPTWIMVLPACSIGLFSVGVLNVNNIRDMKSDEGLRMTVPLRIGERRAKIYHTVLVAGGWLCLIAFNLLRFQDPWHYLGFITLPLYIVHLRGVWTRSGSTLDPMLPMLVMSTFVLALLTGFGYLEFLLCQ